jgi:hypothetical protein
LASFGSGFADFVLGAGFAAFTTRATFAALTTRATGFDFDILLLTTFAGPLFALDAFDAFDAFFVAIADRPFRPSPSKPDPARREYETPPSTFGAGAHFA